jgi:hypothetical protein
VELYINKNWTKRFGNAYLAEAFAWSSSGNHATIYTTGHTAEEADATLIGALRELKVLPISFEGDDALSDERLCQLEAQSAEERIE